MARIRIGIVSWNVAEFLDRCLASLPAALDGLDADIVVVDNASDDPSAQVAASAPGVTLVRAPSNLGYARAMNRALAGDADVLVALNPDTAPPPGSLRTLVEVLAGEPGTALVGPRLVDLAGDPQQNAHRFPSTRLAAVSGLVPPFLQRGALARRWWLHGASDRRDRVDVDWLTGAVHVVRASALAGAHPYRERWFMYAEDLDLCWRLREEGWRVRYVGDVTVPHVGNAAGAQAFGPLRTVLWWQATYRWYAERHGRWATRSYAAINLAASLLRAAARLSRALVGGGRPALRSARSVLRTVPVHAAASLLGDVRAPTSARAASLAASRSPRTDRPGGRPGAPAGDVPDGAQRDAPTSGG